VFRAQSFEARSAVIGQREVLFRQGPIRALDGYNDLAGEHVLRESLAEELIAADTGATLGKKANVVVLSLGVPRRRNPAQQYAPDQPGCANSPGMHCRHPSEKVEHAWFLPGRRARSTRCKGTTSSSASRGS